MLNTYSTRVVLTALTGIKLSHIPVSGYRGLKDLCYHLEANPRTVRDVILEQHPELDVNYPGGDLEVWVEEMEARFGVALKFEGIGE